MPCMPCTHTRMRQSKRDACFVFMARPRAQNHLSSQLLPIHPPKSEPAPPIQQSSHKRDLQPDLCRALFSPVICTSLSYHLISQPLPIHPRKSEPAAPIQPPSSCGVSEALSDVLALAGISPLGLVAWDCSSPARSRCSSRRFAAAAPARTRTCS